MTTIPWIDVKSGLPPIADDWFSKRYLVHCESGNNYICWRAKTAFFDGQGGEHPGIDWVEVDSRSFIYHVTHYFEISAP